MATFIVASRQGETLRQRYVLGGVSFGLVVALILFGWALYQYQVADKRGKIALSRQLATQSLNLPNQRYDLSLLLSLEAVQIADTVEAKGSLLENLTKKPQLISYLHEHLNAVFSPRGELMASRAPGGDDIFLWDLSENKPLGPLKVGEGTVRPMAFSPDGKILALARDRGFVLVDVETRRVHTPFQEVHESPIKCLTFSPDNKILASGSEGTIMLWNVAEQKPLFPPLHPHNSYQLPEGLRRVASIDSLAFRPDGKVLASGVFQKIIFWNVDTGEELSSPPLIHGGGIMSMAFSPDGKYLASGGDSRLSPPEPVILWDVATGTRTKPPLQGHEDVVDSVAFRPDGKILASASRDNTIRLWEVETHKAMGNPLTGHKHAVSHLTFSREGKTLASADDQSVMLWDYLNQSFGRLLGRHSNNIWAVAFNPKSGILASGGSYTPGSEPLMFWDVVTRTPLPPPLGHGNAVRSLAFSPDGKILASGSEEGGQNIVLWDVASHRPIPGPFAHHGGSEGCLAFSPNGSILASGGPTLWDITVRPATAFALPLSGGHKDTITGLSFSPDGQTLASGSLDKTLILWNVAERKALHTPFPVSENIKSLAYSPDGKILALGVYGEDKEIILWNVLEQRPIDPPLRIYGGETWSLAFSPDGKTLASGGSKQTITLWDIGSRQPIGLPLRGHENIVTSVSFSPDGKILASGSWDKQIILWDVSFESWTSRGCGMANRNLTHEEWKQYIGDLDYRPTCPVKISSNTVVSAILMKALTQAAEKWRSLF